MKSVVYNQKGEEADTTLLPKEIFNTEVSPDTIHQVVVSLRSNERQGNAHSKGRGEVRGGGKKPWRQKGTGRARHGSVRSPIWIGGGVTFGPNKERNYKKRIPCKIRKKALFGILSLKAKNNQIFLIDDIKIKEAKTKIIKEQLEKIFIKNKISGSKEKMFGGILLITPENNKDIAKASRNIKGVKVLEAKNLNILDLIKYKNLFLIKDSIGVIKKTFIRP